MDQGRSPGAGLTNLGLALGKDDRNAVQKQRMLLQKHSLLD